MKNNIESNFTTVEQAILEMPFIDNINEITLQNLPSIIEQIETEFTKQKRYRTKEGKDIDTRRVCINYSA